MLTLRGIHKSFEGQTVLDGITFEMRSGEVLALLGPSGSGKSTLLSIVAGLETPDRGQVLWDGEDQAPVPAHRRGFGLMFQDFALFPHRDVFGNVAFGLQMTGLPEGVVRNRVGEVLELVGLDGFDHREVGSLSGGEQQRVALARALAPQPRLLMLDEPFGSLDRALRTRLLDDLARILRKAGQTSIYVTHDQEEAYALADRIVLLHAGRVEQIAAPEQLYLHPASAFVARFLGLANLLPGKIVKARGRSVLQTPLGVFPVPRGKKLGDVLALFRPDAFTVGRRGKLKGKLITTQFQGRDVQARIQIGETMLTVALPSSTDLPAAGKPIQLSFNSTAVQVFPRE